MALVATATIACSTYRGENHGDQWRSTQRALSSTEPEGTPYPSLLEAIQALRGQWLHKRGTTSFNAERDVVIYLDGSRLGGPATLRQIPVTLVVSVRYFSAPEAQSYFGLSHPNGAIVVSTKI